MMAFLGIKPDYPHPDSRRTASGFAQSLAWSLEMMTKLYKNEVHEQ